MANLDDIRYLSYGLELAARLRDIAFNVDDDQAYKGDVIYYVDAQILDVLVDPIYNLIDVELFGRNIQDATKSEEFFGKSRVSVHLSIAKLIFSALIGDSIGGKFNQKLLLHPEYDDEVKSAILFHGRAARTTRRPKAARPDPTPSQEQLQDNIETIRDAIERYRKNEMKINDAYVRILENMSGILYYALEPSTSPLAIFRDLISRGLFSSGRDWLSKIKSDQELRESSLYDSLYDAILDAKEHQVQLERDARSEAGLRIAVSRDALAISSALELNRYMLHNKINKRALFLTADSTLLNLLSSRERRKKILDESLLDELRFNFIRSPIELPELFCKRGAAGKEGDLLQRIKYFDYFLDREKLNRQGDYRNYVNAVRFHEQSVEAVNLSEMASLPTQLIKGVEYELRYVLRDLGGALAGLQEVIDKIETRLSDYKNDISQIVDAAWDAADGFADSISQVVGISLLYGVDSRIRSDLRGVLEAIISGARVYSPLTGARTRFPCSLDFSSIQIEYFQGLAARGTATARITDIFPDFDLDARGEVTLANAYLYAVVGDWRKAERLAHQAVLLFSLTEGGGVRIVEATFFRAVATRYSPIPMPSRWSEAADQLRGIVERDKFKGDLRYIVEYATLGLSVPYHIYHYGVQYDIIFRPDPEHTLLMLRDVCQVFRTKYPKENELSDRLAIQLYANLCLIYIFTFMIEPKMQTSITAEETRGYLTALEERVGQRIDRQQASSVMIVLKAVSLDLSTIDARDQALQFRAFAVHLEKTMRGFITGYDMHKLKDLRAYFEVKASRL
jgi:hypothetical protein